MSEQYPCAGIRVTVTTFTPTETTSRLHGSKFSKANIQMVTDAGGRVSQDPKTKDITVAFSQVVDLAFGVDSDVSGHTYQPVGISFFDPNGGDIGTEDFPTRTVTADPVGRLLLTVHDAHVHQSKSFKFNLVIQQEDGALGVIDPQVSNALA